MALLVYKQRSKNPNLKSTAGKNYAHVRYIATRPRTARNEGMDHGLFGCLIPGSAPAAFTDWQEVAQLVYRNSKKHVTMYRSVVSFGEDTASELRLTDQKAWQRYIGNHIRTVAEKNHIRRKDLQWAAAVNKEKGHPHLHVVFWDKSDESARIKNPFTHPSIPDKIRRQMIKDTFADRIRAYGEEKNRAVSGLRGISDGLVDDFERHIRLMGNRRYRRFRRAYDPDAELEAGFDLGDKVLNETARRVSALKAALPERGRIAYQLLPEELKGQADSLTAYLLSQTACLRKLKTDYVESKMKMVYLYGGSDTYLSEQRGRFGKEADKVIANRILGMVRLLNRLDQEGRTEEWLHRHRRYHIEEMLIETLDLMASLTERGRQEYEEAVKMQCGELSEEARKELYLQNRDRGYEH